VLGFLSEGVGCTMTTSTGAADAPGKSVLFDGGMVGNALPKSALTRVAVHAVSVGVGLVDVDLSDCFFQGHAAVFTQVVVIDVQHALHLGQRVAIQSVVGVALVTTVFAKKMVAGVSGSE